MKRIRDDKGQWAKDSFEPFKEADELISKAFKKLLDDGYDPADVFTELSGSLTQEYLFSRLRQGDSSCR